MREEESDPLIPSQETKANVIIMAVSRKILSWKARGSWAWLCLPLIAVNMLIYCLQVISVMFVGHLSELALSSASMATSFASVTGFSVLLGMGSALETLCGQAYGAEQHRMLGEFNRWMIPGHFAYGVLQCLIRFLQTQNIVVPMVIISGITAIFHAFLCWIFLYKIKFGCKGAALATAIS
ncbi:hypothetical protein ACS0TY_023740 [Phlomoides rotata]